MSNVSDFNTTASGNDAIPPDGFPEGQAASTVNNAARELMAAIARWYGDTQGSLVTGGTGNAYTLTSNSGHAALADQSMLVFRADRANTGSATLAVDSLAAKTIKVFGANLESGDIAANQIIAVAYNSNNDTYDLLSPPVLGSATRNAISNEDTTLPSILSGTKANRPSAGTEGRWYYATDERRWYRDTGSLWETKGGHLERVLVTMPGVRIIPDATNTEISFASEIYDVGDWWSSGTDITVPRNGFVIIQSNVTWAANSTGERELFHRIANVFDGRFGFSSVPATASGSVAQFVASAPVAVTAGEIISVVVTQTSGGDLNLESADTAVYYIE